MTSVESLPDRSWRDEIGAIETTLGFQGALGRVRVDPSLRKRLRRRTVPDSVSAGLLDQHWHDDGARADATWYPTN